MKKPAHELNEVEISSPVSPSDLRLLTRGRLVLSISSLSKPSALRLSGNVVTKTACELFQTTLNSAMVDNKGFNQRGVSGLAWLYLNNEGSLVYNVQVDGLNDERQPVFITLVDVTSKRKMELEDLTPSFYNGWANGTIDKLSPKVLEPLYSGNLAVNVATLKESSLIKGKLSAKLVADARDAPAPVLLKREDYNLPSSAVGMAWINIDSECHLHYDVTLSGLGSNDRQLQLYMDLLPMIAPGAPVITKLLDEFQGMQVEGSPTEPLLKEELDLLDSGVGFIKVKENKTRETLLAATLKQASHLFFYFYISLVLQSLSVLTDSQIRSEHQLNVIIIYNIPTKSAKSNIQRNKVDGSPHKGCQMIIDNVGKINVLAKR